MKNILLLLLVGILAFGCQNAEQAQEEETEETVSVDDKWAEMMVIHDEVMPKMGELRKVQTELEKLIGEESTLDADAQEKVGTVALALEAARSGMMDWMMPMKDIMNNLPSMPQEEALKVIQEKTDLISKVSVEMKKSLADGKALLEEFDTENNEQ
ncbi:MAG: hypothetical protein AAFO07_05260 [Bacteroidota bacterium]